jgi:hypothetical protein
MRARSAHYVVRPLAQSRRVHVFAGSKGEGRGFVGHPRILARPVGTPERGNLIPQHAISWVCPNAGVGAGWGCLLSFPAKDYFPLVLAG